MENYIENTDANNKAKRNETVHNSQLNIKGDRDHDREVIHEQVPEEIKPALVGEGKRFPFHVPTKKVTRSTTLHGLHTYGHTVGDNAA